MTMLDVWKERAQDLFTVTVLLSLPVAVWAIFFSLDHDRTGDEWRAEFEQPLLEQQAAEEGWVSLEAPTPR